MSDNNDYSRLYPEFFSGRTGREIKKRWGLAGFGFASYLIGCKHKNWIGFYYLPLGYISHDLGISTDEARAWLDRLSHLDFCRYDPEAEVVWVVRMASWQIAGELSAKDKRCRGIQNTYGAVEGNAFLGDFFDMYSAVFHLSERRGNHSPGRTQIRGFEGASKGHASPFEGETYIEEAPSKPIQSNPLQSNPIEREGDAGWPVEFASLLQLEAVLASPSVALQTSWDPRAVDILRPMLPIPKDVVRDAIETTKKAGGEPNAYYFAKRVRTLMTSDPGIRTRQRTGPASKVDQSIARQLAVMDSYEPGVS